MSELKLQGQLEVKDQEVKEMKVVFCVCVILLYFSNLHRSDLLPDPISPRTPPLFFLPYIVIIQ